MKTILNAWLVGFCFLLTSCGDSPDSVAKDMMDLMKEVTEIVKGVNDGDDASDAIEEINDLKGEMKEIAARRKTLEEDQSDKEKEEAENKLEEEYGDEMKKVMGDLTGELTKLPTSGTVGAIDVAKAVQELMMEMK